jgi:succinate-acetate transporter protein
MEESLMNMDATATIRNGNPLPLGFAALGFTTGLFGTYLAGHAHGASLGYIGLALFVAGITQMAAAALAYFRGDDHGAMLFGSSGTLSLILGSLFLANLTGTLQTSIYSGDGTVWFYLIVSIVATYIWLASVRVGAAATLLTALGAAALWAVYIGVLTGSTPGTGWVAISGWISWGAAIVAGYASFADLLNQAFGKILLPDFAPRPVRQESR